MEPKIRLNGFSGEWSTRSLKEKEFTILAGGDIDRSLIKEKGKYPVVANALSNEGIVGYYDRYYRVKAPAVSVTGRGEIGHAQARKVSFTPVVRLLSIVSNHDVDFLANAINCHKVVQESTGVPQLTTEKLSQYIIAFPNDVEEEKAIGNYIVSVDSIILSTTKKIDTLKQIKTASLQSMFPQEGESVPKVRFKGFEGEWKKVRLGDITKGFMYGINAAAVPYDGSNKYLRITDIDDSTHIFLQDSLTTPGTNLSYCDEYIMQEGDIVVARTGASVGKSYIYHESDGKVYFAGFLIRIRLEDIVNHDFVFQNTLSYQYSKYIKLVSMRSGQPGVNVDELKSYKLCIPSFEEQQKIADYFTNLDKQISLQSQRLEKLKQIKAACLDMMFV